MTEPSGDCDYIVIRIRRPPFVVGLAIAQLLLALTVSYTQTGDWHELFTIGVLYTQPFVLGAWLVLGFGHLASRVQWTLLTFAILLAMPSEFPGSEVFNLGDLVIRITHFVAAVVIAGVLRRMFGLRLRRDHERKRDGSGVTFSIKSLLLWTAAWAGYLAFARVIAGGSNGELDWSEVGLGLGLFGLLFAPLASCGAMALSMNWMSRWSMIVFAVSIFAWSGGYIWLSLLGSNDLSIWLFVMLGGVLVICLAVIPLRLAGYRLRRFVGKTPKGAVE